MSLLKSFNLNYLKENLKKSKGVLAVFLGLIPILNLVITMGAFGQYRAIGYVPNLIELSIVNYFGLYIIPVVLSICLFGFVFKKKSVDFVNSMPISKKTLFVTNSVGGILILLAMAIINLIILLIVSLIASNVIVPIGLIIDYFILWFVSYVFVFTATNVAMTVSGNAITQIVVTLLIVFLVPFLISYSTEFFNNYDYYNDAEITCKDEGCQPENYYCYSNNTCTVDKTLGIYHTQLTKNSDEIDNSYTTPYLPINAMVFGNSFETIYNPFAIIKMAVLSIAFYILGLFLFKKRKMEINETSFKSIHTHSIVKCLTLIPIILIFMQLIFYQSEAIYVAIGLTIITAYFFIYDVITKRGIKEVKISLIYLMVAIILIAGFGIFVNNLTDNKANKINVSDITSVAISPSGNLDNASFIDTVFIEDKELINMVVKAGLEQYNYTEENVDIHNDFIFKMKNGTTYSISVQMPKTEFMNIFDTFTKHEEFVNNLKSINMKNIYAIKIGDFVLDSKKYDDIIDYVKEELSSLEPYDFYRGYDGISYNNSIAFYSYEDHQVKEQIVYLQDGSEITTLLANFNNDKTFEMLNKRPEYLYFNYIRFNDNRDFNYDEYNYLMEANLDDFIEFVTKESNEKFTSNKDYLMLSLYIDNGIYTVYTNNTDGYEKLIEKARNDHKDNAEYKSILQYGSGWTVE